MTRNNRNNTERTPSPSTIVIEDNMMNLPDLSAFLDDEKQHILDVLLRDENLRNKHLSRFMQLRKEVAELKEHSQSASKSICARCQTPFGFIFNTGDTCPKCSAKVCKQCRLIYNVNDNSWLCQLCCKQMQLMSYSGEWMYSIRSDFRKDLIDPSETLYESVPPFVSAHIDINPVSSSDSEPEDLVPLSNKNSRFSVQPTKPKESNSNNKINKMIVQNHNDEQKLNYLKKRLERRPLNTSLTQPLPRRIRSLASTPNTVNSSSDEVNSSLNSSINRQTQKLNKQNSSISSNTEILTKNSNQNINVNRSDIDSPSIRSSELDNNNDNKSESDKLKVPRRHQSFNRGSKLSLTSTTTEHSSSKHVSTSMQSLRRAVHRISHPQLSLSRSSLHSEKQLNSKMSTSLTMKDEDTKSLKVSSVQSTSSITMTKVYHLEQQQTILAEHPSLLIKSEMPSFYPPTGHRTFLNKHLANHDDDPDSIYKEAFIIEIFQHWKAKALEHQHTVNNSENIMTSNDCTQTLENKILPVETSNIKTISNETSSNNNKNELSNTNEPQISTIGIKKRTTPLTTSNTRRKASEKKCITTSTESSNPNLLAPYTKNKYGIATATTTTTKKPPKSTTIFIEPRKTQPTLPQRPYSFFSFEESVQMKRKTTVEKQNGTDDDQSSPSISPTWTPASYITSTRSYFHSQNNFSYDDETSSDESSYESLLIRNRKNVKKTTNIQEKNPLSNLSNLIIPTAIYITDPNGNSRTFDWDDDSLEDYSHNRRIIDKDLISTNTNISYVNNMPAYSSSSTLTKVSSTEQINHDKHALHSIGEEEEDAIGEYNYDGSILSKELDGMETFTHVRKTKSNVQTNDTNRKQHENDRVLLGRRWSDSFVSDDDEDEHIRSPQRAIVKAPSATSIIKPPVTPPAKLSKTKYLLMKLHLTSSSPPKNENLNTSVTTANLPPRKRTVHRSSDKKHSRTNLEIRQSSIDESKEPSNISNHSSPITFASTNAIESPLMQENSNVSDSIIIANNENDSQNNLENKLESVRNHLSPANSDNVDDITETVPLSSQSSLNSAWGDMKFQHDHDISGTIELKLSYNINTSSLDIYIKKCTDLARVKRNQTSNPYCKIYLLPDKSKASKRKTTIKKDTIEPVFNEAFRYHLTTEDFNSRILWVSMWSQTSLGHNNFLGEIHIPLVNCILDKFEVYTLLARMPKDNLILNTEPTADSNELHIDLTFITDSTNKELGTIQVNSIQGKMIYHGKHNFDIICKGLLMPDKIKRKLVITRKGPSPKWDIPLRWENISRSNLKNISIEISLWRQERFRKVMISFIRLNSSQGQFDNKLIKSLNTTEEEKSAWELFLQQPTSIHHIRLPLRPATTEHK
ncbi:unnamed protein product [Rotaria sp. Silwood1]|nr:unnamed protein product [Rotaria sp. Silwood1]CAF1057350.1 unnamed protein product [Rotaria sp. Silwood1]CAF3416229.1 unnamed protein product [Rotaria sp. Silwood1]CAF4541262.1 unnamed protein product [Rotaria sp. Silwood1]